MALLNLDQNSFTHMAYVIKRVFYVKSDDMDRTEKNQGFYLFPYLCFVCPTRK